MSRRRIRRAPPRRQRGLALLVAMLMLALMMYVGTTTMETAIVEQKVGASMRDRTATFEGAEAAGLQSIQRLRALVAQGRGDPDESAGRYFGGMLPPAGGGAPTNSDNMSTGFWWQYGMPETNSIETTLVSSMPNVARARYLIERLAIDDEGEPSSPSTYPLNYNRLTVFGGGDGSAEVLVQTTLVTLPK